MQMGLEKCDSKEGLQSDILLVKWEFPKIRGTLFSGPCNKDPTI